MVNSLLLRPLPVRDAERITELAFRQNQGPLQAEFSVPEFQDIQNGARAAFDDVVAYETGDWRVADQSEDRTEVDCVSGNFFGAMGVQPELGRFIAPGEGDPAVMNPVMVLGYSYWKTQFGGALNVVGRSVL